MNTLRKFLTNLVLTPLVAAGLTAGANAASIVINVVDAPGIGFNDPTPVSPVGGNTGATLGEQRLQVFEKAAEIVPSRVFHVFYTSEL